MIQKSTLNFLKDLAKHNNRDWMHANKKAYEAAKQDFMNMFNDIAFITSRIDDRLDGDIETHKYTFRINRDVRFSKDKKPYNPWFSGAITPGGRKKVGAGYFIRITPGESAIAAGMHSPEPKVLKLIREHIDNGHAEELRDIIADKDFQSAFGGLDESDQLKTAPRGFPKDHPDIDLLRNKSFFSWKTFSDEEVMSEDFTQKVIDHFKIAKPLDDYLNDAVKA